MPQARPRDAELVQHGAEQRQAEPNYVVVITLDSGDKWPAQTIDGEAACDLQRLQAGDIGLDLVIGDLGEVHHCGRHSGAKGGFRTALHDHVVIAGYGRTGRAAARVLHRAGIPFVVVEINHAVYGGIARDGFSGIWGDVAGDEILKAAGAGAARLLLLAVPDQSSVRLAVQRARSINPAVPVVARAIRREDLDELRRLTA